MKPKTETSTTDHKSCSISSSNLVATLNLQTRSKSNTYTYIYSGASNLSSPIPLGFATARLSVAVVDLGYPSVYYLESYSILVPILTEEIHYDHEILPTRYRCALAGPLRLCNIVMGAKVWYSHPRLPWDEVRIALAIQRRIPVLLNRVRFKHVCTYRNMRSPWYIEGNIQQVHVHIC